MLFDCHTHDINRRDTAIVCGAPRQVSLWAEKYPQAHFSVGIHPWDTAKAPTSQQWHELETVAKMPQVVAIGETGLDALRGAALPQQKEIFLRHISLAESLSKPLVLHIVRSQHLVLQMRQELLQKGFLTIPWIFHGFRGKPDAARQLLATATTTSPIYISLGAHFNPLTAISIPAERLLVETDDSPTPISAIAHSLTTAINDPQLTPQQFSLNLHHAFHITT